MQDDNRGCGCNNDDARNCCGSGPLGGLFGTNCCGDNGILFFIIIFLLLFTNNGCCGGCRR